MVYIPQTQTARYHERPDPFLSTSGHFHDVPGKLELPMDAARSKTSTFGKLYPKSEYFMHNRTLDKKPRKAMEGTTTLFPDHPKLTFSGSLGQTGAQTYRGNGTFQLLNGLTYSWRAPTPVKLVPYKDVEYKSEYQDGYCKTKKPFPGSTLRRAPQAQQPAR